MFFCENHRKFGTFSILLLWNKFSGKTKTLFEKLEYRYLVEILSTKIESKSFLYKTASSKANVKANRMLSTKCTYRKGVFPVTNFFFWKFCFGLSTSCKELIWCTDYPNVHTHTFRKRWTFMSRYFFP